MSKARSRDQPLGLALGGGERAAIGFGCSGNRDVHQPDRAAAHGDGLKQPCDKIAMNGAGVAPGTILEHAEAVHDEINRMLLQQGGQGGRVERQDRQLDIERAHSLCR
ncbi:hypothetical protein ACVW0W_002908 [Bradyrhizobium sp. USDA 4469]